MEQLRSLLEHFGLALVFLNVLLEQAGLRNPFRPARTSWLRRLDSRVGDIRGTPRRRSLKRSLPATSSRTISSVHRSSSSSIALATGQNW